MSAPGEPWVVPPLACADTIHDEVDQDQVAAVASELLFVLSGRQFGTRQTVVRPRVVMQTCTCQRRRFPEESPCSCATSVLELAGPIVAIDRVTYRGDDLAADAYEVHGSRLVRVDGGTWPCCQDPANPILEIDYSWGKVVPEAGLLAATELACHLAYAAHPSTAGKCKLPAGVQTVTRQGVTLILRNSADLLKDGKTGLPMTDLFLTAYNPSKLRRKARVFSPDFPKTMR